MRFLIAGLGSVGRRHLRNLLSLGQKDVVLLRTGLSTLPDEDLAGFPVERDIQSALTRWSPDAVIVSNPTAMHLDVAIPAAEAGCHLLIEKPVSHNLLRVGELQDALQRGGGRVLVGFQYRFHPGLCKIRELLDEEAVGRPICARAHWGEYLPEWHPWEDYRDSYASRREMGGGVLLTLCHPFDYLRWMLGETENVVGLVGNLGLGLEVEETAIAALKLVSSVIAAVHLDYNQRPPARNLEIAGEEGTIRWDFHQREVGLWTSGGKAWQVFADPEGFERNSMFLDEMQHFLALARGETDSRCTLDDGVAALHIALAVRESAAEGRAVALDPK